MSTPATTFPILFIKAIKYRAGYALYGNPPRWHKIAKHKPIPKKAPVVAHPHAAGEHEPAKLLTDDQWHQLKLPETNTNAPSYNKALENLKALSEAGNVTGILALKYGTNTYAKKLVHVANHLLTLHGSEHKVSIGQGAGSHPALQGKPADAAPVQPAPLEPKPNAPAKPEPKLESKPDAAPKVVSVSAELPPKHELGPAQVAVSAVDWRALKLPSENVNAKTVNKKLAALKEAASEGDAAKVAAMKFGVNTYGKKLAAAQAKVLAALGAAPAPAEAPKASKVEPTSPPAPAAHSITLHHTTDGHNKFYKMTVRGSAVTAHYGKIGAKGVKSTKEYASAQDALDAAHAMALSKQKKGYFKHDGGLPASAPDAPAPKVSSVKQTGPKEGDTKQGVDGMLVLKNGRWVKMGQQAKKMTAAQIGHVINAMSPGKHKFSSNAAGKAATAAAKAGDSAGMKVAYQKAIDGDWPFTSQHIKAVAVAMGVDVSAWPEALKFQSPAPASAPVDAGAVHPTMDGWKKVGDQKGSNSGGVYEAPDGTKYYVKFPKTPDHAHAEVLAAKLYELAGIKTAKTHIVQDGDRVGIASRWDDSVSHAVASLSKGKVKGIKSGFAVDAWLGNRDVVGEDFMNVMVDASGSPTRIDVGASLDFRAQGEKKEFGPTVGESTSLLDPKINAQTSAAFKGITKADIAAGVAKVAALSDSSIRSLVMAYGYGSDADKQKLADTLIARKEDLLKQYPGAKKKLVAKKTDMSWVRLNEGETVVEHGEKFGVQWAKIKVPAAGWDPTKIAPPPDFFKNGSQGPNGLWKSSHAHINEANNAAATLIHSTATTKELADTVEGLTFQPMDKSTGKLLPGALPMAKHPAAEIKEYFKQVTSELNAQTRSTYKVVHNGSFTQSYNNAAQSLATEFKPLDYEGFQDHAHKAADYLVLNKSAAAILPAPEQGMFQERNETTDPLLKAFKQESGKLFAALTSKEQKACKAYTGSSYANWNQALRSGDTKSGHFDSVQPMVKAFQKCAIDIPEGTVLWRGIGVGEDTYKSVVGAVIQDGSFQSCSFGDKPAFGGYSVWLKINVTNGVKGVHATNFSKFGSGEREVIIQNNVRYAVLSVTHHNNFVSSSGKSHGSKTIVELIALPHEGYTNG